MADECEWCEGAGCDECVKAKKPAAKGKAKKEEKEEEEECGWCEGAGCDECKPKASKKAAAPAAAKGKSARADCKICEGIGCDACEKADSKKSPAKPAKKGKCPECDGAGCFECEPEDDEDSNKKGGDEEEEECWCGGEGCDECGGPKKGKAKKVEKTKKGKGKNCDFCDDAGCPACEGGDDLTPEVALENAFYEAEDVKRSGKPAEGLAAYKKVLDLGKTIQKPSDQVLSQMFKATEMICLFRFHLKEFDQFREEYRKLIQYTPKVAPDEGRDGVEEVVNTVASDFKLQEEVFDITREELKKLKDTERFLFHVNMRQVGIYMEKRKYREAEALLNRVHASCRLPDGSDDGKTRAADLVDIYAQKITIQLAQGNALALKDLERRTRPLLNAVVSAKSQSILRECFGKMYGDDGDWATAKTEFFNAFTGFQQAGLPEQAKNNLKYTVIATMLGDEKEKKNLFDAREAKVYEKAPDVAAIAALRMAYEKNDVEGFTSAAAEIERSGDSFLLKHLSSMIRDFQGKAIVQICKPYRRVRLDHIARSLKISSEQVENLLIQLILDGDLAGVIDQVKGLLDLTGRTGGGAKKYAAIDVLAHNLLRVTDSLEQPQQ